MDDFFGCDPEGCMVTGGSCLTAMCKLLGFPTDPDKNDDKAWDLAVLGARVALDVAAMSVSAAVDANKAQRWATELGCMTREKKCSQTRRQSICWSLAGRQGRCFVKPFYARANAPFAWI